MAETGRLVTWESLPCAACGAMTFLALVELRAKPGGGTTINQVGWQCSACGIKADILEMQRTIAIHHRQAELKAMEAELAAEQMRVVRPVTPSPRAS